MGGPPAETTRASRDRLKGQPQEGQHSAAAGGTRDLLHPASDSKAISQRVGTNFTSVKLFHCCACREHGLRMFTEQVFSVENDMAKKAKKAKKTAKAATKKLAKKSSNKKK